MKKNFVRKAAGACAVCAFTIGMNVVVLGPADSTLLKEMGVTKMAKGMSITKAQPTSAPLSLIKETLAPLATPSIDLQEKASDLANDSQDFIGPMPTATVAPTATPAPTATAKPVAKRYQSLAISVAKDYVNVRKSNSTDSKLVGKLQRGSAAKILKTKGGWIKIQSGDVTGFVKKEYVATGARAEKLSTKFGKKYAIVKKGTEVLNVREEKDTDAGIVTQIKDGDAVAVQSVSEDWVKVKTEDGETGYVAKEYVSTALRFKHAQVSAKKKTASSASSGETKATGNGGSAVAKYALQFVGNPYVWGGTSLTNGADCSGFVMRIYEKFGYSLPHSSAAQAGYGKRVSLNALQPGDLVFYKHGSSIGHVAMYIGGGRIVHAAGKKWGIITGNVNYHQPYCARRLL